MTTPKKKQNRRPTAKELPAAAAETENGFDDEAQDDIEAFFAGQQESAVVSIYRVGKAGERDGFLDMMSISALMNPGYEQVCRDAYGPGHYKLKLRVPEGRGGKMVFGGSKTITIAERPGVAPGAANGRGHGGPDDFWREESNKQQQLILALIGAQKPQTIDFAGLAAMMTALSGGNKQSDLGAVVAAFTSLKQAAEPADTVATIQKALDLARSLNGQPPAGAGGDEPDTSWPGIIKGALSAFAGAGGGGGAPRQPARALPAAPGRQEEFEEDTEPGEDEMMQRWLAGTLQFLKGKALAGKPVEFWIQYTIDNADEPGAAAIFTALRGGATFEHLLAFDPEIAQNAGLRVWFQKFYDGLKNSLNPAKPMPWIVGDRSNTPSNENAGGDGQPGSGSPTGSAEPGKP